MSKFVRLSALGNLFNIKDGYFVDVETFEVWSTLRTGIPQKLTGTLQSGIRVYNLQLKDGYSTRWSKSRAVQSPYIRSSVNARSKSTPTFTLSDGSFTVINVSQSVEVPGPQRPEKGWLIGSFTNEAFSFSSKPVLHKTEQAVNAEIVRLAKNNPGKVFVKVRVENFVTTQEVVWK